MSEAATPSEQAEAPSAAPAATPPGGQPVAAATLDPGVGGAASSAVPQQPSVYAGYWGDDQRQIVVTDGAGSVAVQWLSSMHCPEGSITVPWAKIKPDGALEFQTRFPNSISRAGVGTAIWTCTVDEAGALQCSSINDHQHHGSNTLHRVNMDTSRQDWAEAFEANRRRIAVERMRHERRRERRDWGGAVAMMLVPVNGRELFTPLAPPSHLLQPGALPPAETVVAALRRESELRKDPATLAKFIGPAAD